MGRNAFVPSAEKGERGEMKRARGRGTGCRVVDFPVFADGLLDAGRAARRDVAPYPLARDPAMALQGAQAW